MSWKDLPQITVVAPSTGFNVNVNGATYLDENDVALTPTRIRVNLSSTGDNTVVSSVTGKKIRIIGGALYAAGQNDLEIKSGSSTILTDIPFVANFGTATTFSAYGDLETASGEALVFNLSTTNDITGYLTYVEV